jgi:AcrR family transcriptional regulator
VKKKRFNTDVSRKQQILDIAIQEIVDHGYSNTSVDTIAAKAGISKGVIYYHFNGKRELIERIYAVLLDELFEYRRSRVENEASAGAKLQAYIQTYFEFMYKHKKAFVAMMEAGIDLASDSQSNPWARDLNDRVFRFIAQIIEDGQKSGEFRAITPLALAPVIQGALDGIAIHWFADPEGLDLDACRVTFQEMIAMFTGKELPAKA